MVTNMKPQQANGNPQHGHEKGVYNWGTRAPVAPRARVHTPAGGST